MDLSEAVDYILGERPSLAEDDVWAVLVELRTPPAKGGDGLALQLLATVRPEVPGKVVKLVLREWRAYVALAREADWEDD